MKSNDEQIDSKLSAGAFSQEASGTVRIQDDLSPVIAELADQVNAQARETVGGLAEEVTQLSAEAY